MSTEDYMLLIVLIFGLFFGFVFGHVYNRNTIRTLIAERATATIGDCQAIPIYEADGEVYYVYKQKRPK